MNYQKIYNDLCQRSLTREWKKFTYEIHHIIPKSIGGTNKKTNLAILTPREHVIAHMLLVRFLTGKDKAKMVFALHSLLNVRNNRRQTLSSKQYDALRREIQIQTQCPEYRSYRSELTRAQWTPERRAAVSEKTRQQWVDGPKREILTSQEYREKKKKDHAKRLEDPKYIEQLSAWATDQWQDPTRRPDRNRKKKP